MTENKTDRIALRDTTGPSGVETEIYCSCLSRL